ncbi:MAG TPA: hypothetical protein VGR55_07345, partial [Candidatus Acidoferrum sp.]|nr:hypothetical protein [Candidatus Acidoferrum sp.]
MAKLCKPFKEYLFSGFFPHLSADCTGVTSTETSNSRLDCSRAAQQAPRKEKQRFQKRQNTFNRDPRDPKRKQNQPN